MSGLGPSTGGPTILVAPSTAPPDESVELTRTESQVPRRNRVDPWGDLWAVADRGRFTGNRGCVVDESEQAVRHHAGTLWIICVLRYRDHRSPLAAPRRWTPLFFLDDAVALAAGHRPCAQCRRDDYRDYRDAVTASSRAPAPLRSTELDARLNRERLRRPRGRKNARLGQG